MPRFTGRLITNYQRHGSAWMIEKEAHGGAFLCDEMGLGKTVQLLSVVANSSVQNNLYTLVVCPPNLIKQWQSEIKTFLKGEDIRIKVVSYGTLLNEANDWLYQAPLERVIFDEAHEVRNPKSKRYEACMGLKAKVKWIVTGTPVFNSQKDFLTLAALLGHRKEDIKGNLVDFAANFVLRRTKEDVQDQNTRVRLPPLHFENIELEQCDEEFEEYMRVYKSVKEAVNNALASENAGAHQMEILGKLTHLKQASIHPAIKKKSYRGRCLKTETLIAQMEAQPAHEKTLIFTHYKEEQNILRRELGQRGWELYNFEGSQKPKEKAENMQNFKTSPNKKVCMLIQIKAGGVGLNIQEATRIYITHPAWNPATELQAIGRSHRTRQEKPVWVKKIYYTTKDKKFPSIEESIMELQNAKNIVCSEVLNDPRQLNNVKVPAKLGRPSISDIISMF